METDELVALLRRDSEGVNQRISDLDAHLGERIGDTNKRIDDLATHLGERLDDTNVRLDRVDKRFEQVDKRFDEQASYLRTFEQRLFDHLQSMQTELGGRIDTMQTEFGRRIDAVQQFRLQGLALVVAFTATSAIVGTFALQLLAAF